MKAIGTAQSWLRRWVPGLSVSALLGLTLPSALGQMMYSVTETGAGCAYGINDKGQVVGWPSFLYSNGGLFHLGMESYESEAVAINKRGDVAGWYQPYS